MINTSDILIKEEYSYDKRGISIIKELNFISSQFYKIRGAQKYPIGLRSLQTYQLNTLYQISQYYNKSFFLKITKLKFKEIWKMSKIQEYNLGS